jgi:hypothetical protein
MKKLTRCLHPFWRARLHLSGLMLLLLLIVPRETVTAAEPALQRAHAHNDYEHPRPLLDALEHGFCSVEADIHLMEGELRVAHDAHQAKPGRTLEVLYLEPLRQRIQQHGNGRVHASTTATLILLVDIKSDADTTYQALAPVLQRYSDILTRFAGNEIHTNAVMVILSGNRPRAALEAQARRYAAMDGRPEDLDGTSPVALIPLISSDWRRHFTWRGEGELSQEEQEKLRQFVRRTHQQGRALRFWGSPDRLPVWKTLHDAGVDWINTDDLAGLRRFLLAQPK